MPNLEAVCKRLDAVTDKLSTQVRTLSIGVLAFTGGLLIGDTPLSRSLPNHLQWQLVGIACLGFLVLFLDLQQYVAAYIVARRTQKQLDVLIEAAKKRNSDADTSKVEVDYDEKYWVWRRIVWFFWAKFCVLLCAVLWLAAVASAFIFTKLMI